LKHRIISYFSYWLNALGKHSLQAPFIYKLYTETIVGKTSRDKFQPYRQLKSDLSKSDELIENINLGANSKVQNGKIQKLGKLVRDGTSEDKKSQLLFRLAAYNDAKTIVELGTSIGINSCYLSDIPGAQVHTFEGSGLLALKAQEVFSKFNKSNIHLIEGNIDTTLPHFLTTTRSVDFAFIDANHRYAPTINYYQQLKSVAHGGSVFVFDDIFWSEEMTKAWHQIIAEPEVTLSIDLFDLGIIFFLEDMPKQHYQLSF
jgi:predicted O-methyltransferase YrrM